MAIIQSAICSTNIHDVLLTNAGVALSTLQSPFLPASLSPSPASCHPGVGLDVEVLGGAGDLAAAPHPALAVASRTGSPTQGDQLVDKDGIRQEMYLQGEEFLFSCKKRSWAKDLLSL